MKMFILAACNIAGYQHYNKLTAGGIGSRLALIREPNNQFDPSAVRLDHHEDGKLGYVPRTMAAVLALLMDNGYALEGRIVEVVHGDVLIEILMEAHPSMSKI